MKFVGRFRYFLPVFLFALILCVHSAAYGPSDLSIPSCAEKIVYGQSGAGRELAAYRFGDGDNVLVVTFAIHGWEDNFNQDGGALVYAAGQLMSVLEQNPDAVSDYNWSVYVLPCLNPDGLLDGHSHNGPGRLTTSYLTSSGELSFKHGIDMNRCFPTGWKKYTNVRNYNGSQPLAAKEAQALAAFMQSVKGSARNVCIDTHGWTQQIITSDGTNGFLYRIFKASFPGNLHSSLNGSAGYFTRYASTLGYTSCLFEFPRNVKSLDQFKTIGYIPQYTNAILSILKAAGTYIDRTVAVTVTASASGYNSIIGAGKYKKGDRVTLTAFAMTPLVGWYTSDDTLFSAENPLTFTVENSITLTALFDGDVYTDIMSNAWYRDYALQTANLGLMHGISETVFAGNIPADRGTMIAILARLDGCDTDIYPASPFVDAVSGSEYEKALNWAYANRIIYGTDETHFSPDSVVTRQDFSTILMRYLCEYRSYDIEIAPLDFTDSESISEYAVIPVQQAVNIGLLTGYEDHSFRPKNFITRAECAALVLRAANYMTEHPSIPPEPVYPDVPDPVAPPEWIFGDEIPTYEEDPSNDNTIEEPFEDETPEWLRLS